MAFTAETYVDDVLAGRVVAGRWARLACERHRRDLHDGHERGLWFDERAARMVIVFFEQALKHSKGEWAGKSVRLEPWQQAHFWMLFGWKRADGSRRFRTSYLEVARKNGKSLMAAGVGLYMLVADGERGADVYSAATKRDQAKIIHGEAVRMVKQSAVLQRELELFKDNVYHPGTFGRFEPLSSDYNSLDGLNVHCATVDELHAHKNGELWDVLETATGARRQPLMYAITTAGEDRHSICFEMHDYTKKVLDGVVEDDAHYGIIYALDRLEAPEKAGEGPVEDWTNEGAWIKANPNIGISKKWDNMRDKATKARHMPSRLHAFLQKELNVWEQSGARWILPEKWRACNLWPVERAALAGRPAWGGLDLSSTLDITAWVLVVPTAVGEGEARRVVLEVLPRFWIPEDNIRERVKRDRVPYDAWLRQGLITATPGDVVDYDFIEEEIKRDMDDFRVMEIAFDPWNATSVSNNMQKRGATMVQFRQGVISMNPAMKALEVAIVQQEINHGGHPVLTWMADNVVTATDAAGNMKPDKSKSREKIDGIVALIMAHQRAKLGGGAQDSVYKSRGIRTL